MCLYQLPWRKCSLWMQICTKKNKIEGKKKGKELPFHLYHPEPLQPGLPLWGGKARDAVALAERDSANIPSTCIVPGIVPGTVSKATLRVRALPQHPKEKQGSRGWQSWE